MSHLPPQYGSPAAPPSPQPDGAAQPIGPAQPVGGYGCPSARPVDPAVNQAAWRFSARVKNNTVAWLLWIGGPFLIGLPIHDFYFGAIGRGIAKILLIVMIFLSVAVGMLATPAFYDGSSPVLMPLFIGLGVAAVCVLVSIVWWILDGVHMTERLERVNERIRREIAAEQGIDPWSF